MAVSLNREQRKSLDFAQDLQVMLRDCEAGLGIAVQRAIEQGVPLNTLARELDVSRTRVRRLARVEKSE